MKRPRRAFSLCYDALLRYYSKWIVPPLQCRKACFPNQSKIFFESVLLGSDRMTIPHKLDVELITLICDHIRQIQGALHISSIAGEDD